jgi:SynChlorMet cassette protein ScmC
MIQYFISTHMNFIKSILDDRSGYCIRLANGQVWNMVATIGATSWLEKLASIMELEVCDRNGYPKLVFIRREKDKERQWNLICSVDPNIEVNLARRGWKAYEFPAIRIWFHRRLPDVLCEIGDEAKHEVDFIRKWLALYPIFQMAQSSGGLPFHAGLVERDGRGVLLAASGNTGKSTCCRRLHSPWHSLCDDETLVVRDNLKRYLAHPFPTWSVHLWRKSEQTWNVEEHVPLSAIFFLEQAETDEVIPMGQGKAAASMIQSAMQVCDRFWSNLNDAELRAHRKKVFENACELAKSVSAFKLRVSLTGRFWEEIEKVLL